MAPLVPKWKRYGVIRTSQRTEKESKPRHVTVVTVWAGQAQHAPQTLANLSLIEKEVQAFPTKLGRSLRCKQGWWFLVFGGA